MNISIFGVYLQVDPETNWERSPNNSVTNLLDKFRSEEEDCEYIYTKCDNDIIVALPISYIIDGEMGLFFLDLETKKCKHIQNHKFYTFIQNIKLDEE